MSKVKNLIAGAAGAIALNVLHETLKKESDDVPRVDLLGEDAVQKVLKYFGSSVPDKASLYKTTLAGDLISNTLYYSLIGVGKKKNLLLRGAGYGLAAGIGALTLTKPMGLSDAPVTRTDKTKILTVVWYFFGGLVTAVAIKELRKHL